MTRPFTSLDHPVWGLVRLAHVEEGGAEDELPRVAVPVAPRAQQADVLLDLLIDRKIDAMQATSITRQISSQKLMFKNMVVNMVVSTLIITKDGQIMS